MKKRAIVFAFALALLLSACGHTHTWADATCTTPKTCTECGETEGEALGHTWIEATCTEPKTCSVCGETEGEPLGHVWAEATCTKPKTCSVCGETEGKPLGHVWVEATCTEPKTCSVCGEVDGEPLGHTVDEWTVVEEATCTAEGTETGECTVCGETVENPIPKTEHTPGEWVITKEATVSSPGERTQSCTVCGKELKTEEYTLTPEEIEANYKASCTAYDYDTIARNPDEYLLTNGKYTGEIIQVIEKDDKKVELRVDITKTRYGYTDTIYVLYTMKEGEPRLLEDDIVTIYGINMSTVSYESVMGATITIPCVYAEYIDLN